MFESRHRSVFSEEDVINMFPVVKHLSPTDTDATQLIQQSQATIHQGKLLLVLILLTSSTTTSK